MHFYDAKNDIWIPVLSTQKTCDIATVKLERTTEGRLCLSKGKETKEELKESVFNYWKTKSAPVSVSWSPFRSPIRTFREVVSE